VPDDVGRPPARSGDHSCLDRVVGGLINQDEAARLPVAVLLVRRGPFTWPSNCRALNILHCGLFAMKVYTVLLGDVKWMIPKRLVINFNEVRGLLARVPIIVFQLSRVALD